MEFFGSLLDDESQNNFDFLKETNLQAQQGGKDKKSSFTNSLLNFAANNPGSTANNLQNPSFFSQTSNIPAYNSNYLYTPLNNNSNSNNALPKYSSNYQDGKVEENYNNFPNSMISDAFDLGTFPLANKQKISSELMEDIKDFEEMFMGKAGRSNIANLAHLNPSLDNNRKLVKAPHKKEEMNPWKNYEPIIESNEDDDMKHNVSFIKENLDNETVYRRNERERPDLKRNQRGEERVFRPRDGERRVSDRELPDPNRKEYIPREVVHEKLNCYNEAERDDSEQELDQYPGVNSKKTRFNLHKNGNQPNRNNASYIPASTNQVNNESLNNPNQNKNKQTAQNPNLKIVDNTLNNNTRSYDSFNVEKTKKNTGNKKVAIYTENKKKEALMVEFIKDYQTVFKQLQEKKEKLKMISNLSKFHERLYSKNEDFRKKVPLFIEKYLESYQRNLENYKLIVAIHDTEIDDILNEFEQRMEKIKEKFKF